MPEFQKFIEGATLIAHNAKFDMAFIRNEFHRQRLPFNHRYICTLEMSRRHIPHLPNHKLATVYKHLMRITDETFRFDGVCQMNPPVCEANNPNNPLSLEGEGRVRVNKSHPHKLQTHRALDDARMAAAIWLAMEGK